MSTPEEQKPADTPNTQEPEVTAPAIDYEKRYKDTQASYTRSQQLLKAAQAENEALKKVVTPTISISADKQKELDDLMYSDPQAWRKEMNQLEADAQKSHDDNIATAVSTVTAQAELERRAQVLAEFNQSHELNITDETIQFDVPPRLTKKLELGEVTFEQYLDDVADYLKLPKKVATANKTLEQPNLGKQGGDNTPTKTSQKKSFVEEYRKMQF